MLVYDVTDRGSFTAVRGWMKQIELVWVLPFVSMVTHGCNRQSLTQHADVNVSKILIGNKCDLERERVSLLPFTALGPRASHYACSYRWLILQLCAAGSCGRRKSTGRRIQRTVLRDVGEGEHQRKGGCF
jgi:GTPase SAR1 family protein